MFQIEAEVCRRFERVERENRKMRESTVEEVSVGSKQHPLQLPLETNKASADGMRMSRASCHAHRMLFNHTFIR